MGVVSSRYNQKNSLNMSSDDETGHMVIFGYSSVAATLLHQLEFISLKFTFKQ